VFSVPSRALVLLAVLATFIASGQCFGSCGSDPCGSMNTPANSCHHQPAREHSAGCPYQHLDFVGPQAAVAKADISVGFMILPLVRQDSAALARVSFSLPKPNTGPPLEESRGSTISILRI